MAFLFYVVMPVVVMRAKPMERSEVVSQAIFSESVTVSEHDGDWIKIATEVDRYSGWVKRETISSRENPFLGDVVVDRCAAHLYDHEDTIYGPILTLPFESRLKLIEPKNRWLTVELSDGRRGYIQRGDVAFNPSPLDWNSMCLFSHRFLGLPYTWGGRSSFGYDCSGYVQMLYRQMGIHLPRDARDQCGWEKLRCIEPNKAKAGDLIFWGHGAQDIRHVGMSLGDGKFIHATSRENVPYLRVSHLADVEWNGSGTYPYLTARTYHEM